MRSLDVKPKAQEAIEDVADFLELINTPGSSVKWVNKLEAFLEKLAAVPLKQFPFCNNANLARQKFSCSVFNKKWVVVFRYTENTITVYRFVLGAKLK